MPHRAKVWLGVTLAAFSCVLASPGQTDHGVSALTIISSNAQPTTVGMEGQLVVILPEAGLTTKAPDISTPVHLRIAYTRPHGTLTHYDLRYVGRLPGEHDLRDYLFRTNGLPATNLPPLKVSVTSLLPADYGGWLEQQDIRVPSLFGGYRGVSIVVIVLWIAVFFVIVRFFRKPKPVAVEVSTARPPTFAERLRPLIEKAAAGQLTAEEKAMLERMLLVHWQRRLDLMEKNGDEVMLRLRQHPEAGVLLGALEDWLHRPPGRVKVEVERVLAPYRNVPDEELAEARA